MPTDAGTISVEPQAAGAAADTLATAARAVREAVSTYLPQIQAALAQACAAGGNDVAQFQQQAGPALQQLTDGTAKVESSCDSLSSHCETTVAAFRQNDEDGARQLLA
jgi:hypothetical protein